MPSDQDFARLREWVGRSEVREERISAAPIAALAALLDRDDPAPRDGDAIPPLGHWLYFLPAYRQSDVGHDGHALKGGFLPPVPLPRRMWAGSRVEFGRPLRIGAQATRRSTIRDVTLKQGRSGALVFVTVRHEVSDADGIAVTDEHDIVYRDGAGALASRGERAPASEAWCREIRPDPVLLFRYSAVTFNSHRIHYDRPYATGEEGYAGLVVHGPLIATLLVDLFRRQMPAQALRRFSFRASKPLCDTAPFFTCGLPEAAGRTARLWTRDADGDITMDALAAW